MKNRDYWVKRAEILEASFNKMSADTIKQVLHSFSVADRNIQKEIEAWYQRFADNNEITLADAKKMLDAGELQELKWDVEEYIKKGQENAVNGKWIKELENASARAHISRLEALQLRMRQQCELAYTDNERLTSELLGQVYTDGYYKNAYEIQKGLGKYFKIGALDNERVQKVLSKPWTPDSATFSDRIWKHKTQLLSDLHTGIIQGFVRGEAPDRLINTISKKFTTSKYNAARLIQTEQAFFYSQSQRDLYKDLDVEEYEIVATLDSSTSEICQEMDGKHFKMSEYEVGATAPPFHVNCRSVFAPYYDDWDEFGIDVERAARQDGQTVHIGGNLTYKEWNGEYIGLHSEERRRGFDKSTELNYSSIQSSEYRKRFNDLDESKSVTRTIWEASTEMLNHRNGTEYEDLVFINSVTNEIKKQTEVNIPKKVYPTKAMITMATKAPGDIIAIHNHPGSATPSIDDIERAIERKYKYGLIACHNGKIFKYKIIGEVNLVNTDIYLEKLNKTLYNANDNIQEILSELKQNGLEFSML